jgi:hypothetical protein
MDRLQNAEEEVIKKEENEGLVPQKVTYTLYRDGRFYIVENVPARVDVETGEQFFSPETVEALQRIISGQKKPARMVQTPVFHYAPVPDSKHLIRENSDPRRKL